MPTDARTADAFLAAPAGRVLLALVDGYGLAPADLADTLTAFHLATEAMSLISPWDSSTPARLERLALSQDTLRSIAKRLGAAPELDWWFAPFDHASTQLWSSHAGHPELGPRDLDRATAGPVNGWEKYAHKPNPTILTSAATDDGMSSLIVATATSINDLDPANGDPIRRVALTVRLDARVYEITGPAAWAALARRYPAHDPGNHHRAVNPDGTLEPGEPPEVVPDWPAVAQDWDGVHLPLGAMLLATDVQVTDAAGMSRLRAWDAEGTYWLRWVFTGEDPRPDLDPEPMRAAQPFLGQLSGDAWAALWQPDLLMARTGPEAVKLRSSRAIGTTWRVSDGPRRRQGPPWWWRRFGWLVGR